MADLPAPPAIVPRDLARDLRDALARFGAWDPEAAILAEQLEAVLAAPFDDGCDDGDIA